MLWPRLIGSLQVSSIHNSLALSNMFPYRLTRRRVALLLLWLLLAVVAPLAAVAIMDPIEVMVVDAVVVAHLARAHHGHSVRCALKLGTLPQIVVIVMKKTMSQNSGLWLLHPLLAPIQLGTWTRALRII
jgi:hypothetical protein